MLTLASIADFFAWFSKPWMPEDAGGFTTNVDALNGFILVVCYFFACLIAGLMVWFCIKYRQTNKNHVAHGAHHSTPIEIGWTLPPLVIVLIIFAVGFKGFMDMATPPTAGNAYEIRAEAKKWGWNFYYPNGGVSGDLYIPADRPVKLTLESIDVLHSLFVPAMRAKKDVVPGRFNQMWFEADATLVSAEEPQVKFRLHCTEYCGQGHSQMNAHAIVVHPSDWDRQLEELKKFNPEGLPPVEYGKALYLGRGGCVQCHSVDGSQNTGPTWKNLYGSQRQLALSDTDQMTVIADAEYLTESIRYPNRKKAQGYAAGNMSAYGEGVLKVGDVRALIEYMKSLSDEHQGETLEAFPEGYDGKVELEDFAGGEEGADPQASGDEAPVDPADIANPAPGIGDGDDRAVPESKMVPDGHPPADGDPPTTSE